MHSFALRVNFWKLLLKLVSVLIYEWNNEGGTLLPFFCCHDLFQLGQGEHSYRQRGSIASSSHSSLVPRKGSRVPPSLFHSSIRTETLGSLLFKALWKLFSTMEAKVYEGQTKEYCRGRCVGAQNRHVFHVTLGLIAVPAILWFGCVVPWYINLALEGYPYAILVPIFSVYLAINTLVALFLCSYTDPGILPRGDHPQEGKVTLSTRKLSI